MTWFLFWEHPFGLQLSRRALLALLMGVSAAVYMYAGRAIAWLVQERFQDLGWLVEFALLFWAGVLWLPLYAWMNRMLMGRARLYWEFGRTVIEQAALILDFAKRKEFLARELCARLQLRRVILLEACDAEKRVTAR